ncbi:hypothetical protein ACRDNQ_10820 [Palleronia sp. KMU-117]|uniref:hypothetical protein n=1 Tax=Palleronia sp. KMU-117 TaxID=3434108 RepID=UPI003D71B908
MDATSDLIRTRRIVMAAFGLVAGLAAYAIAEVLPDLLVDGRLRLALSAFGVVFFSATLAMAGPISLMHAAAGGALAGTVLAAFLTWASLRFDGVGPFLETGHPITAASVALAVFLPFWIAGARPGGGWSDYVALFDAAWRIVLRYIVAGLFVLVAWAMIFLGDSLLGVVGIKVIGDVIAIDWVPYAISGAVFATAIAIVEEFADTVSPYLPLRLLRLVLPPLVAVTGLFLVALPFRGLSGLFGSLSSAGVLMSVAVTGITLVSVAADRTDEDATSSPALRVSARLMALFLPLLGGLAVWAIAIRVGQYGWSPDRVAGMTAALACTAYGLGYAAATLSGPAWMARLRQVNVPLALMLGATGLVWLTPVIDAQRISAQSQLARFERGDVGPDGLDLWSLRQEWGRAGTVVLAALTDPAHPRADEIDDRLAQLAEATDRYSFEATLPPAARAALIESLLADLIIRPEGAALPPGVMDGVPVPDLRRWHAACGRLTPAGHPGCVALLVDLLPAEQGDEIVLFTLIDAELANLTALVPARAGSEGEGALVKPVELVGDFSEVGQPRTLDRIVEGDFTVLPLPLNALGIGGSTVFLLP